MAVTLAHIEECGIRIILGCCGSDNRATRIDPQPAIFAGWNGSVIR